MKTGYRSWLIGLLIGLEALGAGTLPSWSNRPTFGLVRIRTNPLEANSDEVDRAYPYFEQKLKKWMDNLSPAGPRVAAAETLMSAQQLTLALEDDRVRREAGSLLEEIERDTAPNLSAQVIRLDKTTAELPADLKFGPNYQRALFIGAAAHWKLGEKDMAAQKIAEALAIHPNLESPAFSLWENDLNSARWGAFDSEIASQKAKLRRECLVRVEGVGAGNALFVNGFNLPASQTFRLLGGRDYRFQLAESGKIVAQVPLTCRGAGMKKIHFANRLAHSQSLPWLGLAHTGNAANWHSVFLVEPRAGEFRLYLYSPSAGLDEVPMRTPVKVADLLTTPGAGTLPIASDAFQDLIQRHADIQIAMNHSPLEKPLNANSLERLEGTLPKSTGWYNDWKFWAIAGGIVGAAAITYFATRPANVQSQRGWLSVTIH